MKGFKGFLVAEGVERTILADGQRLLIPSVSIDKLVDEPSVLREGVREALPRTRDQRAVPRRIEDLHGHRAPAQRKHGDQRTGPGTGHDRVRLPATHRGRGTAPAGEGFRDGCACASCSSTSSRSAAGS